MRAYLWTGHVQLAHKTFLFGMLRCYIIHFLPCFCCRHPSLFWSSAEDSTVTGCCGGWPNDYAGDEDNDEWVRRQTWSRSSTKTTLNNVWTCLGFTLWAQHGPGTTTSAHPECCLVIVVLCHKRIVWILNKRLLRINLFMILAVPFRQKPNALWTRPRRVGRPSWSEDRM